MWTSTVGCASTRFVGDRRGLSLTPRAPGTHPHCFVVTVTCLAMARTIALPGVRMIDGSMNTGIRSRGGGRPVAEGRILHAWTAGFPPRRRVHVGDGLGNGRAVCSSGDQIRRATIVSRRTCLSTCVFCASEGRCVAGVQTRSALSRASGCDRRCRRGVVEASDVRHRCCTTAGGGGTLGDLHVLVDRSRSSLRICIPRLNADSSSSVTRGLALADWCSDLRSISTLELLPQLVGGAARRRPFSRA